MGRKMLALVAGNHFFSPSLLVYIGIFISVFTLVALCAKHKLSKKHHHRAAENSADNRSKGYDEEDGEGFGEGGLWQKNIMMGDKCRPLEFSGVIYYDECGNRAAEMPRSPQEMLAAPPSPARSDEGFGEGGLWQKSILMGDKCQPLEFSGVIYYDEGGNQVAEMPRSPKMGVVAPPSPVRNFNFPVESAPAPKTT